MRGPPSLLDHLLIRLSSAVGREGKNDGAILSGWSPGLGGEERNDDL